MNLRMQRSRVQSVIPKDAREPLPTALGASPGPSPALPCEAGRPKGRLPEPVSPGSCPSWPQPTAGPGGRRKGREKAEAGRSSPLGAPPRRALPPAGRSSPRVLLPAGHSSPPGTPPCRPLPPAGRSSPPAAPPRWPILPASAHPDCVSSRPLEPPRATSALIAHLLRALVILGPPFVPTASEGSDPRAPRSLTPRLLHALVSFCCETNRPKAQ